MKKKIFATAVIIVLCVASYYAGRNSGVHAGAEQMARHLLNPKYNTPYFGVIAEREARNEK